MNDAANIRKYLNLMEGKQQVNEVLETKLPWSWVSKSDDEWVANIPLEVPYVKSNVTDWPEIGSETLNLQVKFYPNERGVGDNEWNMGFIVDKGKAKNIFSGITQISKGMAQMWGPGAAGGAAGAGISSATGQDLIAGFGIGFAIGTFVALPILSHLTDKFDWVLTAIQDERLQKKGQRLAFQQAAQIVATVVDITIAFMAENKNVEQLNLINSNFDGRGRLIGQIARKFAAQLKDAGMVLGRSRGRGGWLVIQRKDWLRV